MNIIQFIIAVFILVWVAYLLCGQTIEQQEKRPTSNAITNESGKFIKIHINNNTKRRER